MRPVLPGAEPFFMSGGPVGCLLAHGFTSSPQEMRQLGHFLSDRGYTVLGLLVAGHGTCVEDLSQTTWRDWNNSLYDAWHRLQRTCSHVCAIGQSLGGSLSLHLAAHVPLTAVVTMASPLIMPAHLLWLARALQFVRPYLPKGRSNIHDPEALARRVAYRSTPVRSQVQALLFLRHLVDDLPDVHAPVLAMHSHHDKTVSPSNLEAIYQRLGSQDRQMVWLGNSGHVLTEDYDREHIYDMINAFITRLVPVVATYRDEMVSGERKKPA